MAGGGFAMMAWLGQFGVEPIPTVGFAIGEVPLLRFLELHKILPELTPETDAVVILIGDLYLPIQKVLAKFREEGLNLAVDITGRKLDAQIKSAAKAGVPYVIFIGEQELSDERFKLKELKQWGRTRTKL